MRQWIESAVAGLSSTPVACWIKTDTPRTGEKELKEMGKRKNIGTGEVSEDAEDEMNKKAGINRSEEEI